ncbi:MAG: CHASE domain-containing protein, partial [Planctomycetes bacterium]|nr:CHASE domain-containing protein [Planctomycetota bacterium]
MLLLAAGGGLSTEQIARQEEARRDSDRERETLRRLAELRGTIEDEVNSTLYLAAGVEAFIRAHRGDLDADTLTHVLRDMRVRSPVIRNIGIAPGNRIRYVEPLDGNAAAIGLYYPDNPEQWPVIEQVIAARRPLLAGPLELVQGGQALIYRVPVFFDGGDYWGMISMVIDTQRLWDVIAAQSPEFGGCVLVEPDEAAARPRAIFGDQASLTDVVYSSITVNVAGRSWQLRMQQVSDIAASTAPAIRVAGYGSTLTLLLLIAGLARSTIRLERANRRLTRATAAAEAATRAKSSFLAMMSHEIRTPMNGVIGMAQMLVDGDLPEPYRGYANTARSSAESLMGILDDILDQSKVESGRLELEDTRFGLIEVVEDVAELFALSAQQKGLDLVCAIDPAVPAIASGDPTRLRQILSNLCGNAVKFTSEGSVRIDVVPVAGADDRIRITVTDTGVGIRAEALT